MNYSIQNSEGIRGTITFAKDNCVAVFRNENSERLDKNISYLEYFKNAPVDVLRLAETEVLQYLLENVNENSQPVITTAFWGNEVIKSDDKLDDFLENGGDIILVEFMKIEEAVKQWSLEYEFLEKE